MPNKKKKRTGCPMCRRRAPAKACPARTNDHSEPGNCRAAPRAFARSTSLCFRAHLRFAASPTGRAQLRRSEQPPRAVLFVHPVLLCLTPSVLATVNAQGRWVFYKRKSAPVTRCAFFLAPPVGLEPTTIPSPEIVALHRGLLPAAHRSVSGPTSASLHRPLGALSSGAVNSRPAPFCLCGRFCSASPRQFLRL